MLPIHFIDCFFCCAEEFSFDVVPLTNFCFSCLCFWYHIQKFIAKTNAKGFFLYFSSRYFMVSIFMFKSSTHFRLVFVREDFSLILLRVVNQFIQHHLLKRLFFPSWVDFASLSNISWMHMWGFISGLHILFHESLCLFLCQYYTL